MSKTILVTGANGNTSSLTIQNLLKGGATVRAMVRDPKKGADLKKAGAEIVVGDFDKGTGLDTAFADVDAAFLLVPPNGNAVQQMHHLITAAKKADVGHVVRMSALKAAKDAPTANGRLHHESDEELKASGLPWTILRPHFFMQNLFGSAESITKEGKLYNGMGKGKLGLVDVRDIADSASTILLKGGHVGKTYTPTGPASIDFDAMAATIGKALGRPVTYVAVPPEAVEDMIRKMGWGEWGAKAMGDYCRAYTAGWGDFTNDDVRTVTGHAPRSFEQFTKEVFAPALQMAPAR